MPSLRALGRRAHREERGGVLVFVAIFMPLAIVLMAFAIDVGNWFEHRRHLQTQADAAALAAAGDVRFPCDASVQTAVEARIEEYGKTLNPQVGSTPPENVAWRLNSRQWEWQDGPAHPVDDTVIEGSPCTAKMIDVKMTEHELPWFFRAGGVVPNINVKARVNFRALTRLSSGALPVGVPDVNPAAVRVWFVDESASPATVIPNSSKLLKLRKNADGTPAISQDGLQIWDNAADNAGATLPLTVNSARIGMRVAISRDGSTTECGQPMVECFDPTTTNGLLFVRGHATTPAVTTGSRPELRDAWLLPGTCLDGYFSRSTANCAVQLSARVDFAAGVLQRDRRVVALAGGREYAMTFDATTGMWRTGASIPVAPGAVVPVGVRIEQRAGTVGGVACSNNAPCTRIVNDVQRHMSISDPRSGPIRQLVVSNLNGTGANSLERCTTTQTACTHDLTVRVGLYAGVQGAAHADSPPISLRVAGGGSQNQSLDCDPDVPNLKDEIAQGCGPDYTVNTTDACPAGHAELWGLPQPWDCVAMQTGAAVNQVPAGMNLRILGDENAKTCTSPNQWPEVLSDPDLLAADPRLVPVFITPYASFTGSGSGTVPVRNFAFFYVTGWAGQGGGFSNPCESMGDDVVPEGAGYIIGHFVKYVQRLNDGSGSETPCDFDAVTPCVAVLTD